MEWKKLLSLEIQIKKDDEPKEFQKYPISELEKDYKSIISSAAFRRLQDKTQVFPLDKSDFIRTRLTHSIEVSTIARQLGIMITKNETNYLQDDFKEDYIARDIPVILSCAGLLHDIGNPPFGHFGEVIIGEWFKKEFKKDNFSYKGKPIRDILIEQMKRDLENFEGNAQALRILSRAKNHEGGYDVNLTYAVLNALVKYPTSSVGVEPKNEDVKKHKFGYFYSEREIMSKICQSTGTKNGDDYVRHPLAYLMEAADDIAYTTADLEDALKKGLFTLEQFITYFEKKTKEVNCNYSGQLLDNLRDIIKKEEKNIESDLTAFQKWMDLVRKWLMYAVSFCFSKNHDAILNGEYKHDMFFKTNNEQTLQILKGAMREFVYNNKEILKLELSAKKIIESLLNDFIYAVLYWEEESGNIDGYKMSKADIKLINIISTNYKNDYIRAKTEDEAENLYLRFMMVTDYISGMTDSYAKNLYHELNGID